MRTGQERRGGGKMAAPEERDLTQEQTEKLLQFQVAASPRCSQFRRGMGSGPLQEFSTFLALGPGSFSDQRASPSSLDADCFDSFSPPSARPSVRPSICPPTSQPPLPCPALRPQRVSAVVSPLAGASQFPAILPPVRFPLRSSPPSDVLTAAAELSGQPPAGIPCPEDLCGARWGRDVCGRTPGQATLQTLWASDRAPQLARASCPPRVRPAAGPCLAGDGRVHCALEPASELRAVAGEDHEGGERWPLVSTCVLIPPNPPAPMGTTTHRPLGRCGDPVSS